MRSNHHPGSHGVPSRMLGASRASAIGAIESCGEGGYMNNRLLLSLCLVCELCFESLIAHILWTSTRVIVFHNSPRDPEVGDSALVETGPVTIPCKFFHL